MPTSAVYLRWFLALLAVFSLILPHLPAPIPHAGSGEAPSVAALVAPDEGAQAGDAQLESTPESGEAFGEGSPGDYPHETDKITSLFALHLGGFGSSWPDGYFVALLPDPIFSFERPPKSAAL